MPTILEGDHSPPAGSFAIVASKFNCEVVDRLVEGALAGLRKHGVPDSAVELVRVPGAFEIPLIAKRMAESGRFGAILALGAVIRGETDHYDFICQQTAAGVMQAGLATGVPILFGVLTCPSEELAMERAGGKDGNKGFDVAVAAVELVNLRRVLEQNEPSF